MSDFGIFGSRSIFKTAASLFVCLVGVFFVCLVFFWPSSETVFNCELLCVNLYLTSNFYDAFFENIRAPAKLLYARTLSVQL